MAITGGIKVFKNSRCRARNGATVVTSSGNNPENMLNVDKTSKWKSNGSDDFTQETITIEFDKSEDVNRIFLIGHNFAEFELIPGKGDSLITQSEENLITQGGEQLTSEIKFSLRGWGDITGLEGEVITQDQVELVTQAGMPLITQGGQTLIVGHTFTTQPTGTISYYEFDTTSMGGVRLQVTRTQIPNQEKELAVVAVCKELGTFSGYPLVENLRFDRRTILLETINNSISVLKGRKVPYFDLLFEAFSLQADIDLMESMDDENEAILVWFCGGRSGITNFNPLPQGYDLDDLFSVGVIETVREQYLNGFYTGQIVASLRLGPSS